MQALNTCDCCQGLAIQTPVLIYNRPGLKAISYRIGNHAQFTASLLARLSNSGSQVLYDLSTRDKDDFTIALLDAWATVADVLTFYQERIANESYLGTAVEQISLVELARLIGYELRPGVAAGVCLAFTIDENAGSTGQFSPSGQSNKQETSITVHSGIKVQSVPGPDEQPQTFETIETIEAKLEWNSIRPRLKQPQLTVTDNTIVVVSGTNNDLKEGDIVLISSGSKLKKISKTIIQQEAKTTWLYLDPVDAATTLPLFNMPALNTTGAVNAFPQKVALTKEIVQRIINEIWKEEDLSSLIQTQGWLEAELKESFFTELANQAHSKGVIYIFRKRASVFGYNAQKQPTYKGRVPNPPSRWVEWPLNNELNDKIYLDIVYEQILPDSYIAVQKSTDSLETSRVYQVNDVNHRSRTDYGLSTKSTVVTIESKEPWWETSTGFCTDRKSNKCDLSSIRSITIYAESEPLVLADSPIADDIGGDIIMLDQLYLGLKKGKSINLSGDRADLLGSSSSELRKLADVFIVTGITVLKLDKPLTYSYIRSSVTINANVAEATHGETVKETLGSGDAAITFQKFTLKQPPLTFINAATPSGTNSTLQIRVNDILWQEVASIYSHGPGEHVYITRQDDQGKTTIIFGDGKTGARLPTGQENIRATYRKGIGAAGLLKANQLSQLLSRPLAVKGVTNPLKTSNAKDPEGLADTRRNARLTIFTLDRIVSLQDYEDFARSFAGIAKALATWTWTSLKRSVYITVAGIDGATVDSSSILYQNLLTAITDAGIPEVPVSVGSYQQRFFRLTANIQVHPDHIPGKVIASVEQQLCKNFFFTEREFGQSVHLSEVITVMQNVEGVVGVDIDELYRSDQIRERKDRIDAKAPRPSRENPFPAELLTIDPEAVNLKLMV